MLRRLITFLVVVLITLNADNALAQAPGYLGKRLIVFYDLYTIPALTNYNENGNTGIFALNTRHVFSVDWCTAYDQSIGISFHLTKSQFKFKRLMEYAYYDNGSETIITEDVTFHNTKGELSAMALGLHTSLYFDQFIAPVGTYFKPEILLINFSTTFDGEEAKKNATLETGFPVKTEMILKNKESYYTMAIGGTIGTHYIFFDRLVFDIGFQFGYVFGGQILSEYIDMQGITPDQMTTENYIPVSATSRLMNEYFFNINAGLGILIF
jgi:hypothetical protein